MTNVARIAIPSAVRVKVGVLDQLGIYLSRRRSTASGGPKPAKFHRLDGVWVIPSLQLAIPPSSPSGASIIPVIRWFHELIL